MSMNMMLAGAGGAAGLPGLESGDAISSPKQLTDAGAGPGNEGMYWYTIPNWGGPIQLYTDFSIDNVAIVLFYNKLFQGEEKNDHPTNNKSAWGTPGFNNEHYLYYVGTFCTHIHQGGGRWYIGQGNNDGSTLGGRGQSQWIAITDSNGSRFSDFFNDFAGTNQFTGSGVRSGGGYTNGTYYHKSPHGTGSGVHQFSRTGNSNSNIWFEYSPPGPDPNHEWTVWQDGNGQYYNSNRPGSTTRWGWMGYAQV